MAFAASAVGSVVQSRVRFAVKLDRNLYDGVCTSCRSKAKSKETKRYLTEAIVDAQKTLLLLVELNNGMSYRAAAKMVGLSTTAAFSRIKKLLPARALDFTEVTEDGV